MRSAAAWRGERDRRKHEPRWDGAAATKSEGRGERAAARPNRKRRNRKRAARVCAHVREWAAVAKEKRRRLGARNGRRAPKQRGKREPPPAIEERPNDPTDDIYSARQFRGTSNVPRNLFVGSMTMVYATSHHRQRAHGATWTPHGFGWDAGSRSARGRAKRGGMRRKTQAANRSWGWLRVRTCLASGKRRNVGCKGALQSSKSKGKTAMISPPMRPHTFGEFTAVAVPPSLGRPQCTQWEERRTLTACQARPTPMAWMWCD